VKRPARNIIKVIFLALKVLSSKHAAILSVAHSILTATFGLKLLSQPGVFLPILHLETHSWSYIPRLLLFP